MSYTILPEFEQDSPEWHEARRGSLGASEVAAALGLSKYQTPLDVYVGKVADRRDQMDVRRAFLGHAMEPAVAKYLREFHPELGVIVSGFSALSNEYEWLSASPDLFADRTGLLVPIDVKTHGGRASDWGDTPPDYYTIQVLVQMLVFDAPLGYLAVLHGDFTVSLYVVERDDTRLTEIIIPGTRHFWHANVLSEVPPPPSNLQEHAELFTPDESKQVEVTPALLDSLDKRDVLLSDALAMEKEAQGMRDEANAIELATLTYAQDAKYITVNGSPQWEVRQYPGRRSVAIADVEAKFPELAPHLIKPGNPRSGLKAINRQKAA